VSTLFSCELLSLLHFRNGYLSVQSKPALYSFRLFCWAQLCLSSVILVVKGRVIFTSKLASARATIVWPPNKQVTTNNDTCYRILWRGIFVDVGVFLRSSHYLYPSTRFIAQVWTLVDVDEGDEVPPSLAGQDIQNLIAFPSSLKRHDGKV
jgi:hypothetical protein